MNFAEDAFSDGRNPEKKHTLMRTSYEIVSVISILLSGKVGACSNCADGNALRGHTACSVRDLEERTFAAILVDRDRPGRCAGERVRWQSDGTNGRVHRGRICDGDRRLSMQCPVDANRRETAGRDRLSDLVEQRHQYRDGQQHGFVTARSNGSVAIRFSYKGSEGFMTLSVEVAR